MHAAPGFVATRWGVEMPAVIRWAVRAMQGMAGRKVEHNAEYMFLGLTNPDHQGGGLQLIDEYVPVPVPVEDTHTHTHTHTLCILAWLNAFRTLYFVHPEPLFQVRVCRDGEADQTPRRCERHGVCGY